jgi:glycyl-tRNA synthetase beta chain
MSTRDYLIEIGTEELPPKALASLSKAFSGEILAGLKRLELSHGDAESFATPRRLALRVDSIQEAQSDKQIERFGPAVKACFDGDGNPTQAALGFAKSCGVDFDALGRAEKDGVEKLFYQASQPGKQTATLLSSLVSRCAGQAAYPEENALG